MSTETIRIIGDGEKRGVGEGGMCVCWGGGLYSIYLLYHSVVSGEVITGCTTPKRLKNSTLANNLLLCVSLPFIFLYLYLFHQMGMGWGLCIICVYVCDSACVTYKAGARGLVIERSRVRVPTGAA